MEKATKIPSNASSTLKAGEFGYPAGHLGHLTASQESALVDFKKICVESGLYRPGSGDGQPPSHTDAVLLRFLRARRFVPKDALQQFRDTEKWRTVNEIDKLYENIDIDNYDEARRLYPQWVGRRDKRGLPVYLFEVRGLDSKRMATYAKSNASTAVFGSSSGASNLNEKKSDSKSHQNNKLTADDSSKTPSRLLRLFALYENLAGFMYTMCTVLTDRPYHETPIVQANNIVDISGVGLKQFWNLRGHMQDASVLATAHYPETLDRIFIVGAPTFFPTVWSWIKRWFDPITVSKIFILSSSEAYPTLSKFIDPECIPRKFGGTLDFTFGQLAPVDPAYADKIEWKYPIAETADVQPVDASAKPAKADAKLSAADGKAEKTALPVRRWPRGPVKWVERADGDLDLLAVGSEKGTLRREIIGKLRVGGDVGGAADPTGPLQQRSAKERAHPSGLPPVEGRALEAQAENAAGAVVNGEVKEPLPAHVEGEGKVVVEENGAAASGAGATADPATAAAAATAVEEVTKSANGVANGVPAVEPVPLDAVATALPGEGGDSAEKKGS